MERIISITEGKDGSPSLSIACTPGSCALTNSCNFIILLNGNLEINSERMEPCQLAFIRDEVEIRCLPGNPVRGIILSLSDEFLTGQGKKTILPERSVVRVAREEDSRSFESYYQALLLERQGRNVDTCTVHLLRALLSRILRVLE